MYKKNHCVSSFPDSREPMIAVRGHNNSDPELEERPYKQITRQTLSPRRSTQDPILKDVIKNFRSPNKQANEETNKRRNAARSGSQEPPGITEKEELST